MATIPVRLDWLRFLGYDMGDEIPNHSVLNKARARWGVDAFKSFFERIVWQGIESGLVDGSKLFMDSSLIRADASNNSVVNQESLTRYLNKNYQTLESRLENEGSTISDNEKISPNPELIIKSTFPQQILTHRSSAEIKANQSFNTKLTEQLMRNVKSLPQHK